MALWGPPTKDPMRLPFIHASPATQASVLFFKHTVHIPAAGPLHLFPSLRIPFTQYPQGTHTTPPFSLSLNATLVEKPLSKTMYPCLLPLCPYLTLFFFYTHYFLSWASQLALVVKNLPANVGSTRDPGSIPESGRSPGGGNDYPLQYSCLGNPTDRGAWRATVHGVAKSQTRLSELSAHTLLAHLLHVCCLILLCPLLRI